MEDRDVIKQSAQVLTAKPVFIQIDHYPRNFVERLLVKWNWRSEQKIFELRPILVGNMYRIASVINQLPANIMEGDINATIREAVIHHLDKLIYIVAVGLQNNKKEPSRRLLAIIRQEFTAQDISLIMEHLMNQLNLGAFLHAIVLAKGMNILAKTSPTEPKEIIAPANTTTPGN